MKVVSGSTGWMQEYGDEVRRACAEDGKTLFLLCAEGERKGKSVGLSYQDSSDILLAAGAKDAIQMDGGGSTSLFVNGKNFLSYPSIRKNAVFIGFSMK